MKIQYHVCRVLLGLIFGVLGLNGFFLFMPVPPGLPPLVTQFNSVMFASHYEWMTTGVQVIAGLLLLINRYVVFALFVIAAVLVNILTFHITMFPQALFPMPILAVVLWFLTCWPIRFYFSPLFVKKVEIR